MGNVRDIVEREYGGPLESGQLRIVTGVNHAELIQGDSERVSLILSNEGATTVLFSLTGEAPASTGISVVAGQKPIELSLGFHGDLCQRQWFAASPGGAGAAGATFSKRTR